MSGALIPDGAAYVPNADALCERLGIVSLNVYDGHVYALDSDGAELPLSELLARDRQPEIESSGGNVTTIKPAARRKD